MGLLLIVLQVVNHEAVIRGELYKKPWIMAGFTFLEIFPVGFMVALISAFIIKRKTTA